MNHATCTNCVFDQGGAFALVLLADTDLLAFLTAHGINPVSSTSHRFATAIMDYEEEILGTEPFEARFTFADDDDTIALTVDDDLEVVEVTRS